MKGFTDNCVQNETVSVFYDILYYIYI